jgi:hypothetical protein
MSNATPLFLITDAGLAAASIATPTGPYIHITSFEIGSGYGYNPQRSDTGLNGNLLYTGTPTTYENIGNNTLDIICEIPPDAGPFDFGEVALYLSGGVMFAKAVFSTPQTKYSSLGTNVVSSYTFHCLLKLEQSTAVFQISTTNGPPAVWNVYAWSDVYPPGISANPDIPLYLVRELSPAGDSSLLQNTNDTEWTVGTTYQPVRNSATVANSSTSWIEFASNLFHPNDLTAANRQWVIETPDGFFRSVSSIVTSGSNYRCNLNVTNDGTYNNSPLLTAPAVGSKCRLYSSTQNGNIIHYDQIVDPPSIPLATVGNPGLAYGGAGLYMPSPGVIEAHGFLHSPDTNTGRTLTSSDDLNNIALPSGLYTTYVGVYGYPANMPAPWEGHIWIQCYATGSDVTQLYWPQGSGGGSPDGTGGYPPYFRSYSPSTGWSAWSSLGAKGRQGSSSYTTAHAEWTGTSTVLTWNGSSSPFGSGLPALTKAGVLHMYVWDDGSRTTQVNLNGSRVSYNTKGGGAGYGRIHHDTVMFNAGDTVDWIVTNSGLSPIGAAMILLS